MLVLLLADELRDPRRCLISAASPFEGGDEYARTALSLFLFLNLEFQPMHENDSRSNLMNFSPYRSPVTLVCLFVGRLGFFFFFDGRGIKASDGVYRFQNRAAPFSEHL